MSAGFSRSLEERRVIFLTGYPSCYTMGQVISHILAKSQDLNTNVILTGAYQLTRWKTHLLSSSTGTPGSGEPNFSKGPTCTSDASDETAKQFTHQGNTKNLHNLPTEILLEIADHLPLSNIVSMSYVCRQLRYRMGIPATEYVGEKQTYKRGLSYNVSETSRGQNLAPKQPRQGALSKIDRAERLKLLCMLERDGLIPQFKYICSVCSTMHATTFFSEDALRQSSRKRECLGHVGRLWVCPHEHVTFDQLNHRPSPLDGEGAHQCFSAGGVYATDHCAMPAAWWPLVIAVDGGIPTKAEVSKTLMTLDAYVCPHRQLKDPSVLSYYEEGCLEMERCWPRSILPRCKCDVCTHKTGGCSICGAGIHFIFNDDRHNRRTLFVRANRSYQRYRRLTDRAWIAQLNYPWEYRSLEEAWNQTLQQCELNMKPDVSKSGSGLGHVSSSLVFMRSVFRQS